MTISIEQIIQYVTETYSGVIVTENWGERGLFYNPEGRLPKGIYLMTFKEKDGENDHASKINRKDVEGKLYRLNLGLSKPTYRSLLGEIPKRPAAGMTVDAPYDFTEINKLMPHPVYAWMGWLGVLNPDQQTFDILKPLIGEAVDMAKIKYAKRIRELDRKAAKAV